MAGDSAHGISGSSFRISKVLYYWPGDGWVLGTVTHWPGAVGPSVVLYGPRLALGAAMVDSLLYAASHGPAGRRVLLCQCPTC